MLPGMILTHVFGKYSSVSVGSHDAHVTRHDLSRSDDARGRGVESVLPVPARDADEVGKRWVHLRAHT